MSLVFIHADSGAVFVTDGTGAVSLASGVSFDDFSVLQATLAPGLVSDGDTFSATTISSVPVLRPELVALDDAFFSPVVLAGGRTLSPPIVADADIVQAPVVTALANTMVLQPALEIDGDDLLATDVGWRLYGQLLVDVDLVRNSHVETLAYLLPNLFEDGQTIDSYPFFIQNMTGGIPVSPPSSALIGSISYPRRVLHGTINRQPNLTGSIKSSTRVLTGSLKNR